MHELKLYTVSPLIAKNLTVMDAHHPWLEGLNTEERETA